MRSKFCTLKVVLLSLLIAHPALAVTREMARQVAAGIAKHRSGDFAGAELAFAAAAKSLPEDLRLAFDQGCALAALGKHDEAEKLFQRAKLARDPALSAASLYNLGCLSAEQAKAKFGERPEEATPDVRADGLKLVDQAVARYRDCLAVDSNHADARHNLELLRLWVKHMQEAWKQHDRDKRRKEMALLEFLEMLQAEQIALRGQTRSLAVVDDSPRRRQAATLLGQSQRELAEEIEPLTQKLHEGLHPPSPDKSAPTPQLTPGAEQGLAALSELAQQAKTAMSRAAADLLSNNLSTADESQTQVLEPLNEIYRAVAPFEHILQKAIRVEEELIRTTESVEESPDEDAGRKSVVSDLPRGQRQVAEWAEVLPPKARQATEQLKAQPAVAGPPPPPSAAGTTPAPDPAAQRDALLAAYGKAIELAPRAHTAASEAAASLDRQAWQEAKPNQEEALKILKEIADQLPKQPNQDQQQDSQNQEQKDKDQKENEQKDQEKKDQGQKKDSDQKQQPQQQPDKSQAKEPQKQDVSRQQAESLLRQVRERERDYREQQKKRHAVIGGVKVDKDW